MVNDDIRWIQRFQNYKRALQKLEDAVVLKEERELTDLEKQGMIQAFEFTHELAWNTLKDFLLSRGSFEIYGSRDATRAAFQANLIAEGEIWMEMIQSRNMTTHTYNEDTANEIIETVQHSYLAEFILLKEKLQELSGQ